MAADRVYEIEYRVDARKGVGELNEAKKALREAQVAQQEFALAVDKYGASSKEAAAAQAGLTRALDGAKKAAAAGAAETSKAAEALTRYTSSGEASARLSKKFADAQEKLEIDVRKTAVELAKAEAAAKKYGESLRGAGLTEGATGFAKLKEQAGEFGAKMQTLAGLGGAVAVVGGLATAARGAAQYVAEAGEEMAKLKIAAAAVPFDIEEVRTGLLGLVDSSSLLFVASKAMQGGLATSRDDFQRTSEAAAKLSLSVGGSAKDGVEAFYGAIATGSPQVLDNLGITLKTEEAHRLFAETLGKTASALTEEEKKVAFATIAKEKLIERAAQLDVTLTASELAVARLGATLENISGALKGAAAYAAELTVALADVTTQATTAAAVWLSDQMAGREQLETGLSLVESTQLRLKLQQQEHERVVENIEAVIELQEQLGIADADIRRLGLDGLKQGDIRKAREIIDAEEQEAAGRAMQLDAGAFEDDQRERKAAADRAKKGAAAAKRKREEAKRAEAELLGLGQRSYSEGNTADAVADVEALIKELEDERGAAERQALARSEEIAARRVQLIDVELAAVEQGSAEHVALLEERHRLELEALERKRAVTTDAIELEKLLTAQQVAEAKHRATLLQVEAKRWAEREKLAQKGAATLASSAFAVADAARESEEGAEVARKRALAGEGRKFQGQLRMTAISETVKAAVALASYNYLGFAQHTAAVVAAGTGALAIGQISGAIESSLPSAGAEAGGAGGGAGASRPSAQGSGAQATEIPVSADPTTRGLRSAADPLTVQVVLNVGTLVGSDDDAIREIAVRVQRQIAEVAA